MIDFFVKSKFHYLKCNNCSKFKAFEDVLVNFVQNSKFLQVFFYSLDCQTLGFLAALFIKGRRGMKMKTNNYFYPSSRPQARAQRHRKRHCLLWKVRSAAA